MADTWTSLVKNATYNRCIIMVAADIKNGWKHLQLNSWEDSWQKKMKDPDGLIAYNLKTGKREEILFNGTKSEVWRIHDGTWVDVTVDSNGVLVLKLQQAPKLQAFHPNRRKGPFYDRKAEGSLTPEDYEFPDKVSVP